MGEVHDFLIDKIHFAVKPSNYFYARKAKRTPYTALSAALSKVKEIREKETCNRNDYFYTRLKSTKHVLLRLINCFFEGQRKKVIKEKGKVHDRLTEKMLFAVKTSDYFYARNGKRTLYGLFKKRRDDFYARKRKRTIYGS